MEAQTKESENYEMNSVNTMVYSLINYLDRSQQGSLCRNEIEKKTTSDLCP